MIGKLTMENYLLKKRERIPHPEEKRRFLYYHRSLFPSTQEGCRLMGIKRSTFYYQKKENMLKVQQESFIKEKIQQITCEHPYYGYRRITAQLQRENIKVNTSGYLESCASWASRPESNADIHQPPIADTTTQSTPISSKTKSQPASTRSGLVILPISVSSPALSTWRPLSISIPAGSCGICPR